MTAGKPPTPRLEKHFPARSDDLDGIQRILPGMFFLSTNVGRLGKYCF
jgi:hypothetical protein